MNKQHGQQAAYDTCDIHKNLHNAALTVDN